MGDSPRQVSKGFQIALVKRLLQRACDRHISQETETRRRWIGE